MSILVYSSPKRNAITDSLRVAKAFGRSHKNVLRPLRDLLITTEFRAANYFPSTYIDKRGREQPLVKMTAEGEQELVHAFTARRANLAALQTYFMLAQGLERVKIGKAVDVSKQLVV